MKVVILAGGKGERMFPLTKHFPKALMLHKGIPLIKHVLNCLPRGADVCVVKGYNGDVLEGYLKTYTLTVVEQLEPTETGALLAAEDWIGEESFLVHYCDVLTSPEFIQAMLDFRDFPILAVTEEHIPHGVITTAWKNVNGKYGAIKAIDQKPAILINAGIFCLTSEVWPYLEKYPCIDNLATLLNIMAANHRIYWLKTKEWKHFTTKEDLE